MTSPDEERPVEPETRPSGPPSSGEAPSISNPRVGEPASAHTGGSEPEGKPARSRRKAGPSVARRSTAKPASSPSGRSGAQGTTGGSARGLGGIDLSRVTASAGQAPVALAPRNGADGAPTAASPPSEAGPVPPEPAAGADVEAASQAAEIPEETLRAVVEALVLAADEPVAVAALARAAGARPAAVRKAVEDLRVAYQERKSGIEIAELAGGFAMLTREEHAAAIRRLRKASEGRKLTGAALETLAVVAYRQPAKREDVEGIRGVGCGPALRTLMEQDLVKIVGRAEALGRPLLYGTTKRFLDVFGLASLKDLPKLGEIQ